MPDKIQLLPDAIANQIAAGEVVQRPASVVKELMENSIDAGSQHIQLIIKDAGKTLIQVIDDGGGMTETDARMSFERHATSKIREADDLFRIKTMGFRGEALASIAAVAQVEMKTKTAEQELGTLLYVEASSVKKQELVAVPQGTTIAVKNLFYNVPARRNFLKSNPVETRHIVDEFTRVALSHPEVAFSFYQNDMETYNLPASKLSQRIVGLFGKSHREQLVPCQEDTPHLNIKGYIGKPEFARKTRGEQFFFINKRYIRDNYLNHAVQNAYERLIAADQYPFYVLDIEIDPKHVDINVHPTKTEVKFDDAHTIYGVIKSAVKQALGAHNVMPSLDFNADVNFESITNTPIDFDKSRFESKGERAYGQFKTVDPREQRNLNRWESLFEKAKTEGQATDEIIRRESGEEPVASVIIESSANMIDTARLDQQSSFPPLQLHLTYILKQVKSGLMVMHQHYAHERILYEQFLQKSANRKVSTQQLLFPVQIELNPADYSLVMELSEEIHSLGFAFEEFGKTTVVVQGMPSDLNHMNTQELFEGLIEQFKWNKKQLSLDVRENITAALAKRSSTQSGVPLSGEEMHTMIDQLFACQQPNYTPDGKPTYIVLGLDKFAAFFNH